MSRPLYDDRMPIASRPARTLATACLVVATLLAAFPAPASALEPPRPLPGYHPRFVTETDTRPWTDCLWASAAMLLDKWTNGDVKVSRQALRAKSGDRRGGSTFDDMKVAFAKYGFNLKFSPEGGTRITWGQMLSRLEKGAGAVLLGDDHRLPRWFGRWDYGFWKKTGKDDNHAVYIERYDRKRGRVWIMDPLARGNWKGEWISTRVLHKFAWKRGGAIYVAMTPTAKPAPFKGVRALKPKMVLSSTAVDATWTLKTPKHWKYPGADVRAAFNPAPDPLLAAAVSPAIPVRAVASEPPAGGRAKVVGKTLHVTAPLPTTPGAYLASLSLRDRRFGKTVIRSGSVAVFIPGDRRASLRLIVREKGVEAGSALKLTLNVANSGTATWADSLATTPNGPKPTPRRATHLEARWIPLDVPDLDKAANAASRSSATADDAAVAAVLEPFTLRAAPLAPGGVLVVRNAVQVPGLLGRWALVVDVVDAVDGSFAALGSAPAVAIVDVVVARGIHPIE